MTTRNDTQRNPVTPKNTGYTADNIQTLEGANILREMPGMYIGGTDSNAVMHLLWETLSNAVDEHLAGHGNRIRVLLHGDGSLEVQDEARGIPSGINRTTGKSGLQMVFKLHSGGKFNQDAYAVSGGLHGVGIAAVAALSSRMDAVVHQGGKRHVIQFHQGVEGTYDGDGEDAPFTPGEGITTTPDKRPASEKKERPSGTSIRFYPDYTIFDSGDEDSPRAEIDLKKILRRAQNTCYLTPELTIDVVDDRFTHKTYTYHHPNGLLDIIGTKAKTPLIGEPFQLHGETDFTSRGKQKHMSVDMVLQWEEGFQENTTSFVNVIETALGGTHVAGAQKALEEVVANALEDKGVLKAKDPTPELIDIMEGMNLVLSVKFPRPDYSSQTKEKLGESAATSATKRVVSEHLGKLFSERRNHQTVVAVLEKIVKAARTRRARNAQFDVSDVMAEADKESVFAQKPEKLKECRLVGDPRSSLTLVEGDSALGNMLLARDANLQAFFPLKGKPLNSHGLSRESLFIPPKIASPRTPAEKRKDAQRKKFLSAGHVLLQNKELDDLIKSIGAGFGETFDVEKMRYHDVIIASDADPDGGHIYSLLIGLFYDYMRPLIEEGRLYKTLPPLFVIKSGKESSPTLSFAQTDQEKDRIVAALQKKNQRIIHIGRRKGLGEMSVEEIEEHLLNPDTRKLRQVVIEDAKEASAMIELTLGKEAAPRKDWISDPETIKLVEGPLD